MSVKIPIRARSQEEQRAYFAAKRQKEGNAIRTTKRDKEFLQRANATYNP